MKLTELLLAELDREVPRSRRALQEVPAGKYDWKPHDKSMISATSPTWWRRCRRGWRGDDEERARRRAGERSGDEREKLETSEALVKALEKSAADAHKALGGTRRIPDDAVEAAGARPGRYGNAAWEMIQDTIDHWAHHAAR